MTKQISQLLNPFLESISNGIIQTQKNISERLQEIFETAPNDTDADDNFFSQDDLNSLLANDPKTS
jgi:hypothetical protein